MVLEVTTESWVYSVEHIITSVWHLILLQVCISMWQGKCWGVTPSRSWAGERRTGHPIGWQQTPGTATGETKVRQKPGCGSGKGGFMVRSTQSHVTNSGNVMSRRRVGLKLCVCALLFDFRFLQDQAWKWWVWYWVRGGYRNPTQLDEISPGCIKM